MSMGPDALGSNTEASTVRWVPPVTSGSPSAVAEGAVAATARARPAVTARVRVTVCMVAPRLDGVSHATPGRSVRVGGRDVLYPSRFWYVTNIGPASLGTAYRARGGGIDAGVSSADHDRRVRQRA